MVIQRVRCLDPLCDAPLPRWPGAVNWRTIDLNLLVVFDAVAQDRSVTRAAVRLNMTQPALSHALARLRFALRDELFVRTPGGMDATPFAQRLAGPVRAALSGLSLALDAAATFDPATSDKTFRIAVDNRAAVVMVAGVAAAVAAVAPHVALHFCPSGTLDVIDCLDRGTFDLAIGGRSIPAERFKGLPLLNGTFVALVRRGHPAALDGAIGLQDLARYPHLEVSSTGEDASFVEAALDRHGLARRVVLRVPLLTAAAALAGSDMIAVVGERVALQFAQSAPLAVLALPFDAPHWPTNLLWHRRLDDVPAHTWLRHLIARVAAELCSATAGPK